MKPSNFLLFFGKDQLFKDRNLEQKQLLENAFNKNVAIFNSFFYLGYRQNRDSANVWTYE